MTHKEVDHRLAAGWHVNLEEADALCSAQRKRYVLTEMELLKQYDAKSTKVKVLTGTPQLHNDSV